MANLFRLPGKHPISTAGKLTDVWIDPDQVSAIESIRDVTDDSSAIFVYMKCGAAFKCDFQYFGNEAEKQAAHDINVDYFVREIMSLRLSIRP